MKAISIICALTVAAMLSTGCDKKAISSTEGGREHEKSKKTNFGNGVQLPSPPNDATHCRVAHRFYPDGNANPTPLAYYIRLAALDEFASGQGMNFEIVKRNTPPSVPTPFKIDPFDRFISTVSGNDITIAYTNQSGQSDKNFHATLHRDLNGLWASGKATLDGSNADAGEIVMFMLPMADVCEHSYYGTPNAPPCRRVMIEHFYKDDPYAKNDMPVLGTNVVSKEWCKDTSKLLETSDGEGHEGR